MSTAPPRITLTGLMALLLIGVLGLPAGADEADGDEAERQARGERLIRAALMRDLELNEQQQQQAEEIFHAHRERTRQWHREHRDELRELTRQMRRADDDPEQRRALRAEARDLLTHRPGLDDLGEAFEDVLTDEQWPQFEQNRKRLEQAIAERLRERAGEGKAERAPRRPRPHPWRDGPRAGPAFEDLDLTDEQRAAMREAAEAHHEEQRDWRREHREQLSDLRQQMREAREADDRDRLGELREQLRELRDDQPTRDDLHARFRDILDDEQWQQLQRNWEEVRRRAEQQREQKRQEQEERQERRDADD